MSSKQMRDFSEAQFTDFAAVADPDMMAKEGQILEVLDREYPGWNRRSDSKANLARMEARLEFAERNPPVTAGAEEFPTDPAKIFGRVLGLFARYHPGDSEDAQALRDWIRQGLEHQDAAFRVQTLLGIIGALTSRVEAQSILEVGLRGLLEEMTVREVNRQQAEYNS